MKPGLCPLAAHVIYKFSKIGMRRDMAHRIGPGGPVIGGCIISKFEVRSARRYRLAGGKSTGEAWVQLSWGHK
jgi:hypothetical protein